ncbi:hypothetical protein [Campylobacter pinnipediorum]|uniref:NrdR family transcriptional regulator n=1 Tax=Campylobacter pinnipediorum TaxID=1965231 RepID=UPI00084DB9F6|nr:hypothetical protein [Campylobacter pinnipediorum]AQW80777.1 putative transcriptional regulator [Campylobacter pinnipediorum subsp. pinnipediorum]AQW83337.1 putative transcriptional regulator [Campylobacter pinnipediorum subsp. pinnipediorum]OPA75420.1 hypothetical protein BFG05_05980 [Campylobacter pinnipediorum subsp. pinnipediorum]
MFCPYCGNEKTRVVTTIKSLQNKRYRICNKCNKSFPTIEAVYFDDYWKSYAQDTSKKGELKRMYDR